MHVVCVEAPPSRPFGETFVPLLRLAVVDAGSETEVEDYSSAFLMTRRYGEGPAAN